MLLRLLRVWGNDANVHQPRDVFGYWHKKLETSSATYLNHMACLNAVDAVIRKVEPSQFDIDVDILANPVCWFQGSRKVAMTNSIILSTTKSEWLLRSISLGLNDERRAFTRSSHSIHDLVVLWYSTLSFYAFELEPPHDLVCHRPHSNSHLCMPLMSWNMNFRRYKINTV